MIKRNGHLKREEVPKYLQSNPRFKKAIEDSEKIIEEEERKLNAPYNTSMITKKEEEEQAEEMRKLEELTRPDKPSSNDGITS